MKFIWSTLISLAFLLVVAAITIYLLIHYRVVEFDDSDDDTNDNAQLFEPTLDGYKHHQLIKFSPANEIDVKKIIELQTRLQLIPWSESLRVGSPITFQVPPNQLRHLTLSTEALHLPFVQLSSNMQDYLVNRKRVITEFSLKKSKNFNLNKYHFYTEIEKYLSKLSEEYSSRLEVNSYGNSIENRQLYYVRIFKAINEIEEAEKKQAKKIVILECGAHSREWLSPAVCLRIIDSLVHDLDSQPLLEEYEFYILPLINPDGYVYSWLHDRMWRKNRRRFANNCYGVDLNRNFNVGFNTSEIPEHIHLIKDLQELDIWNKTLRVRRFLEEEEPAENKTTSSNTKNITEKMAVQCSNLHPGERPFSENETFYLKRLIDRFLSKPSVYISLHSYSQMWLYPFGINLVSPVIEKLNKYAKIGVEHLERAAASAANSTSSTSEGWKYGTALDVMYNAGGISIDWAHKDVGIDLVYTLEMRDNGKFGFLMPEDQIEPAYKETWSGISAALMAYAEDLKNSDSTTVEEELVTSTVKEELITTTTTNKF